MAYICDDCKADLELRDHEPTCIITEKDRMREQIRRANKLLETALKCDLPSKVMADIYQYQKDYPFPI